MKNVLWDVTSSAKGITVKINKRRKWGPSNEGIWSYIKFDGKIQDQF